MKSKTVSKKLFAAGIAFAIAVTSLVPTVAVGADEKATDVKYDVKEVQEMYRVYNPNSGEHFYTASAGEKNVLVNAGWSYEGIGWMAPKKSSAPVYRLYNENAGDHHYTTSAGEKNALVKAGWKDEGIGWYSNTNMTVPLYRQYNPNAFANNHNYTTSKGENDWLVSIGWKDEGIGWYGCELKTEKAVIETKHHDAEYEIIEHPAETEMQTVTKEVPDVIYWCTSESCNASDIIISHWDNYEQWKFHNDLIHGGCVPTDSWDPESGLQIFNLGTKIVTVEEEVTIKEAWTEKKVIKEAYDEIVTVKPEAKYYK